MLSYRAIEPQDCVALVELHHRAFDDGENGTTVFLSPRVKYYLQQLASVARRQNEYFLYGALYGGKLIGYVWGKALQKTWHLNYLAVASEFQGKGIGRALYEQWLETGKQKGYREYSLDVSEQNRQAFDWYRRLGWQLASTTYCYIRQLSASPGWDASNMRIRGWEAAQAWQHCYGFSEFYVVDQQKQWKIGRLAEEYFRINDPPPAVVEWLLRELDPARKLLLFVPDEISGSLPVKISHRLHLSAYRFY